MIQNNLVYALCPFVMVISSAKKVTENSLCFLSYKPELRRAVRTSTWKKDTSRHEHEFPEAGQEGGEVYDEETDTWTKTCKTCGYQLTYEKM